MHKVVLDKVCQIANEISESDIKSGKRFNIFSLLNAERAEVGTHSKFIGSLLDPKGLHGQKDLFLKMFCIKMGIEPIETVDAVVSIEKDISPHGRVDIEILTNDHLIIIENKIDAADQDKQLIRYKEYSEKYPDKRPTSIIYLTLDGKAADTNSSDGVSYQCASYQAHIIPWLEECNEACNKDKVLWSVSSAISQYKNLLDKITGDTVSNNVDINVANFLLKEENSPQYLLAAVDISQVIKKESFKGELLYNWFVKLETELKKNPKLTGLTVGQDLAIQKPSSDSCKNWYHAKNAGKREDHVGFFMEIDGLNMHLHIQVATDNLHYGFVPKDSGSLTSISKCYEFEKRKWGEFEWISKSKVDLRRIDLKKESMQFISSDDKFIDFAKEINNAIDLAFTNQDFHV